MYGLHSNTFRMVVHICQNVVKTVACVETRCDYFISKISFNSRRDLDTKTRGKHKTEDDSNAKFLEEAFEKSEACSDLNGCSIFT